jgi:hypothetical protein
LAGHRTLVVMRRRHFLRTVLIGSGIGGGFASRYALAASAHITPLDARTAAQAPATGGQRGARNAARGPIIDVHMHAYPANEAIPAGALNSVTGKPPGVKDGEAHLQACLAEMKRLNIVKGVVSGGSGDRLAAAIHWRDAAPDRIIAGAGVRGSDDTPLPPIDVLRKEFAAGRLRVLGEVTAQYAGLKLDDPKLRLNIMHGGWPYLQETVAVLLSYPQVYTDLGAINWILPRAEFHAYFSALMRAGLGKRVLFGSDQMYWPEAIGMAVDAVDAATFLTPSAKRDIFHDNAVRFLKLAPA